MSDLIDTTEMYLRTIYELVEDGVLPMRARIAEQLGHSGPTVSQTVARMERDGLVSVQEGDHHLEFTPEGLTAAIRVMRKHRLAEVLLIDVIGLDLEHVHEEACRWEHVMSERVERRLIQLLGGPSRSPYGNVIPGLDEVGGVPSEPDPLGTVSVEEAVREGLTLARVVRLGEPPQTFEGFLSGVIAAGIVPGADVTLRGEGADVVVQAAAGAVVLDVLSARHAFVVPREAPLPT